MGPANRVTSLYRRAPHLRAASLRHSTSVMSESTSAATSDDDRRVCIAQVDLLLGHVEISRANEGFGTFAYQRALANRIVAPKLAEGASCDVKRYKPIFIHDALQLPGSLSNLIGKASPEEIVNRMTPALLPGVHAHIDSESMQPVLVRSDSVSYVQGMVLFGQAREARTVINEHYRPFARRRRVEVEIEVKIPIVAGQHEASEDRCKVEGRAIQAYAWVKTKLDECTANTGACEDWTLEKSLHGSLVSHRPVRVSLDGRGDEDSDGYLGEDIWTYESESENEPERQVVYGGSVTIDYERATYFTGW